MSKVAKGGAGFGHERGFTGITNDWLTPKYIIDAIGPFDLDPCAAPSPRPWDTARNHITFPQDGLATDWSKYGRVFCNPPYGPDTAAWMKKMGEHNNGIALIFARTETKAWQEWVWPFAEGVLFLAGRLSFCTPAGKIGATAGAPSALVAFSPADAERLRLCSLPGVLVNIAGRYLAEGQSSSTPRTITERVKLEEIKHDANKQKLFIGRKCLIWAGDGGAYWLANGCGYGGKSDAGIYDFDDAFDHSRHCGPEKHIEYHFLGQAQRGDEQGERE